MALAAVQPMTRRSETKDQWHRALDRAINEALDVLTEPVSGETFVESATQPGTLYRVTLDMCTCTAGQRGIPCKHRAVLLAQLGILPLDDDPAPVAALVDCAACNGCGHQYSRSGGWRCDYCQGTGQVMALPAGVMKDLSARLAA